MITLFVILSNILFHLDSMQTAVSGLNRGLAAGEEDLRRADAAAKELESAGGVVDVTKDIDKLQGRWKLIYSSAFSSRTLGGSRPGPPIGRLIPITLGQVCCKSKHHVLIELTFSVNHNDHNLGKFPCRFFNGLM